MAGIRLGKNGKTWQVYFRWEGRKCEYSTGLEDEDRARAKAEEVEIFRKTYHQRPDLIPDDVADTPKWIATLGHEGKKKNGTNGTTGTIDDLVTRYLDTRKVRLGSKTKPLSHASYQSDVYRLNVFKDFCKKKKKSRLPLALSPENLGDFKDSLITSSEGAVSVRHKLRTVKALLLWAYDAELIDSLPRAIRKYNDVPLPDPKPEFFTVEEIKTLYKEAPPDVRLWILLGLNCGFTQSDISSLSSDMVDWDRGIIARDRQKTGVESEHKLWPLTLKMLREQAGPGPLLLTRKDGQPLIRQTIKEDGSPSKTDMVSHRFRPLKKKAGIALPFKHFRKTAANAIAEKYQDKPWLVELFLAHIDSRMRKHYTRQHYDELHKATDWLDSQYGLESATSD